MSLISTVHLGLISTTKFLRNYYFLFGSNHMYCDFLGPFLQSAFHQCYLGCVSNRLCLENSLCGGVSPRLHPCIIVGVLSHVFIFCFIIWLLKGSIKLHQSSMTIFSRQWCNIKDPYFLFPGALVLVLRGAIWKIVNWLSNVVLSGWSSHFSVENGKVQKIGTGLVPWLCKSHENDV